MDDADLGLGLGELGLELLGGLGLGDVDDERVGVDDQGRALGQHELRGEDLGAGRAPAMSTSMYSGMWVASASTWTVAFSVTTRVSGAASPTVWIGTSTVTFSPKRTATKSMCSSTRRIGSTWTCLVSASCE